MNMEHCYVFTIFEVQKLVTELSALCGMKLISLLKRYVFLINWKRVEYTFYLFRYDEGEYQIRAHFEEEVYCAYPKEVLKAYVERERKHLDDIIENPVTIVSMNLPAEADLMRIGYLIR